MAVSDFFSRLKSGLSRSAARLTENITATFTKRKLDDEALAELEDQLIAADLGAAVAARIIENFRSTRFGKEVSDESSPPSRCHWYRMRRANPMSSSWSA
jgi:fused signal recognition particle receptor